MAEERGLLNFLQKVSAPIALIVTTVFSYLSWTEARHSSELQKSFFAAQNGPRIALSSADFGRIDETNERVVIMIIKNDGESEARSVCLTTKIGGTDTVLNDTCAVSDDRQGYELRKQDEQTYVLSLTEESLKLFGFNPVEVLYKNDAACSEDSKMAMLIVKFRYEDATGKKIEGINRVVLCGDHGTRVVEGSKGQ